jgi:hypothetical protein
MSSALPLGRPGCSPPTKNPCTPLGLARGLAACGAGAACGGARKGEVTVFEAPSGQRGSGAGGSGGAAAPPAGGRRMEGGLRGALARARAGQAAKHSVLGPRPGGCRRALPPRRLRRGGVAGRPRGSGAAGARGRAVPERKAGSSVLPPMGAGRGRERARANAGRPGWALRARRGAAAVGGRWPSDTRLRRAAGEAFGSAGRMGYADGDACSTSGECKGNGTAQSPNWATWRRARPSHCPRRAARRPDQAGVRGAARGGAAGWRGVAWPH